MALLSGCERSGVRGDIRRCMNRSFEERAPRWVGLGFLLEVLHGFLSWHRR